MGRTVPTSTALLEEEIALWAKFRRALRREDREILDWLFERARFHAPAASYLSRRTPFDAILLSMLIEVVKLIRSSTEKTDRLPEPAPSLPAHSDDKEAEG